MDKADTQENVVSMMETLLKRIEARIEAKLRRRLAIQMALTLLVAAVTIAIGIWIDWRLLVLVFFALWTERLDRILGSVNTSLQAWLHRNDRGSNLHAQTALEEALRKVQSSLAKEPK